MRKERIMNLNKCILGHLYQAAGAGWPVDAESMERLAAGEILEGDHPELSNQLPAALPYSVHQKNRYKWLSMNCKQGNNVYQSFNQTQPNKLQ